MASFTWNHRLVRIDEDIIALKEVSYDRFNRPYSHCEPFLCSETLEGIQLTLDRLAQALTQPILAKADFVVDPFADENMVNNPWDSPPSSAEVDALAQLVLDPAGIMKPLTIVSNFPLEDEL